MKPICWMVACLIIGCIEPQFFAEFLRVAEIDPDQYGGQHDKSAYAAQHALLEDLFKTKTRDEWAALFDGSDACVSPVLDYVEAGAHPQMAARSALTQVGPFNHSRPAPVFGGAYDVPDYAVPTPNSGRAHVSALLGREI